MTSQGIIISSKEMLINFVDKIFKFVNFDETVECFVSCLLVEKVPDGWGTHGSFFHTRIFAWKEKFLENVFFFQTSNVRTILNLIFVMAWNKTVN